MTLVYVTGITGAGKSSVCDALKARGYHAYDVDDDGFKAWYERSTDRRAADQRCWSDATADWKRRHWLKIELGKVEALAAAAETEPEPIFLCGTSAGEDVVWHLFDRVFQLSVGGET